jgi:hypothetical protein
MRATRQRIQAGGEPLTFTSRVWACDDLGETVRQNNGHGGESYQELVFFCLFSSLTT